MERCEFRRVTAAATVSATTEPSDCSALESVFSSAGRCGAKGVEVSL